jgi:hypothetical protein
MACSAGAGIKLAVHRDVMPAGSAAPMRFMPAAPHRHQDM